MKLTPEERRAIAKDEEIRKRLNMTDSEFEDYVYVVGQLILEKVGEEKAMKMAISRLLLDRELENEQ